MFEASLLRSLNIYVVENMSHTLLSAAVVAAVIALFRISQPSSRLRLLLLPVVIPFVAAPIYYLLYAERSRLALLRVDDWINLDALTQEWPLLSYVLSVLVLATGAFLLVKGLISLIAMLYLPGRYPRLSLQRAPGLHATLRSVLRRAEVKPPVVLLSPERGIQCCTFGFARQYLIISRGALDRLTPAELEAVLAHEVGHLRRGDGWLGFIVVSLRNILFFNPMAYLLCQRVLKEAELAADGLAVIFGPGPVAYAESLISISRSCQQTPEETGTAASHFYRDRASVRARVLHVLRGRATPQSPRDNWLIGGTAALLVVGLFFVC